MEHQTVHFESEAWSAARKKAKKLGSLAEAFINLGEHSFDGEAWNTLFDSLAQPLLRKPESFQKLEQFYTPELSKLLRELTGKDYEAQIPALLMLRAEGQFSSTPLRRSYRTSYLSVYLPEWISLLAGLVHGYYFSGSLYDKLFVGQEGLSGFQYQLAYALRQGDDQLFAALREAMFGDNSELKLSRKMIEAIVISGRNELLDDLMKLLLAAKLQEGLRQQILESADKGSTQTLTKILKSCIDNDLFRFSSAVRALDVWTGLPMDDTRPARARRSAQLAFDVLTDEEKRKTCLKSDDFMEVYFALWGQGCHELAATYTLVEQLLEDEKRSRRLLAWYFVANTDLAAYRMERACRHLDERDEESLAWITGCLVQTQQLRSAYYFHRNAKSFPNPDLPQDREERRRIFYALKDLAAFIGDKKRSYSDVPFPGVTVTLSNEPVIGCMMSLAGFEMDRTLVRELPDLLPWMNADQRTALLCYFLHPNTDSDDRAVVMGRLGDRSVIVKEEAVKALSVCTLSDEELRELAAVLRSKSSGLRGVVMPVLRAQSREKLLPLLSEMLQSEEEYQNQAAIELLSEKKSKEPLLLENYRSDLERLRERKLSTQTEILLDQLLPEEDAPSYTPENGYGLYEPEKAAAWRDELDQSLSLQKPGFLNKLLGKAQDGLMSEQEIRDLFPSRAEIDALQKRLQAVFERHADYEYEADGMDGSRHKRLFGDLSGYYIPLPVGSGCYGLRDPRARLDMLPFAEEFREAFGDYARDVRKMLGLYAVTVSYSNDHMAFHNEHEPWFLPIQAKGLAPVLLKSPANRSIAEILLNGGAPKTPFTEWTRQLIGLLVWEFDPLEVFDLAFQIYRSMIAVLGEGNLGRVCWKGGSRPGINIYYVSRRPDTAAESRMLGIWRELIHKLKLRDEDFALWFPYEYRVAHLTGRDLMLSADHYFRAWENNIITRDVLMEWLLKPEAEPPQKIRVLTGQRKYQWSRDFCQQHPRAQEIADVVIDRMVSVEEKRGELPTPLTMHCLGIERLEGAGHFCRLLAALGKDNFVRGYEFSRNTEKRAVLSRLLKRCYPAKDDTPEELSTLLKATDISDKRLAEAVMYAPQWAGFAEQILNWPGLKSAVWFFHAHINENFSAEKETEVALYSPISPQRFNDGAFDKNWFFEAYNQLGEKRFQTLYKSAKYITTGSNQHRRSQLYADAVLGRLNAAELRQEIIEKRNQEKLRCYPLIPIAEGDTQEALRRYEFIQQFLKESKQFGAQRRESEKKACLIALENLAITAGYSDVNRLIWQMETAKTEELRPLREPVDVDGYTVSLKIDDEGEASVAVEKGGKALKTLPKALTKNEIYLERKESAKELKEQKRRARESLERAMTEQTEFTAAELQNLLRNPVLSPMVKRLLWCSDDSIGFLLESDGRLELTELNGIARPCGDTLRLAHPHDLKTAGVWADFMHLLFEQKLVQPFKQVFREYYPLTADERQERTISRRYAGFQVQPKRTLGLLKARGWTVDYEEGLQKVFYKENLVVRMFAMADWFSPADIEAPTLETVEFFNRETGENVALEEIPPVLFSEVMRDLDLVVSVAYVGGVDPEASHSTVELRLALAGEIIQLLHLNNVQFVGSHARIEGKLASWSVHMGSGIVHAQGKGMVAILPVHSQARGRIFLPFADDDPKTAEILSKIVLLAEDTKIKDPGILGQL